MTSAQETAQSVLHLLAPPPVLRLSEWADRYFQLSPEYAAKPGPWHTLPYQRGPMDAISDPRVRRVVVKSATQLLKSVLIQTAIGYFADVDPGPMLLVQPGDKDAKDFSKERLAPMIRDTPRLRAIFRETKRASSDGTITEKLFPGGMLAIAGGGSPRNVARRTIRFLFCDEIDKYKATAEGNVIGLARKRQAWFRHRAKEIDTCSPTFPGSEIDRAYLDSDQRQYFVPCPLCGVKQSMIGKFFKQVRFDTKKPTREEQANTARYYCEACDAPWDDAARWRAVDEGEWQASAPFTGVAGFWISELYSYQRQLSEIVLDFLTKKDNVGDYQGFVNTTLAENWTEPGEAPDWTALVQRREKYPVGVAPDGALFLTAGADVHPDRIEVEIVGWGRNRCSWSVAYKILQGRTSELTGQPGSPSPWEQLAALMAEPIPNAHGAEMVIARLFVDSGNQANDVYQWVRGQSQARVTAIKGVQKSVLPVGQPSPVEVSVGGQKIKRGLKIRTVWTDFFKAELYSDLRKRPPTPDEMAQGWTWPPGYCHFPDGENFGDEHFQQLCAEALVSRTDKRGRVIRQWETTRPRNEALDCRIYARAAAWDMGLDRLQERHWRNLEAHAGVAVKTMPSAPEHQPLDAPVVAGGPPAPQMRSPLLRPRRLPVRSAYLNSRP